MSIRRPFAPFLFGMPVLLAGCSLFPTTRHLPVPKAPARVQDATPKELVESINKRWDALNTLTATVEIQATELKTDTGLEKDFPSCRGYIVLRKPNMLRVAGTYFGARVFDMASDGNQFTLVIPMKNLAIKGSNSVKVKSPNQMLNLRPDFFLDSIIVRGLNSEDEFMSTADTITTEDAAKKHLFTVPEYVLSVVRRNADSQELTQTRRITFHRDDLLPYGQEIYDSNGNLETEVTYSNYASFSAGQYPSKVTIKRPLEGIQLVLTVVRVQENVDLPADEFEVQIPAGSTIQKLE
jgi:outer membrane lipoprotein-sorting protein